MLKKHSQQYIEDKPMCTNAGLGVIQYDAFLQLQ
jgi:hypothetical protein